MSLTALQLRAIREQIGATSPPTDEELEASFTLHGNTTDVVLEVLRGRLADFVANPTSVSIPNVYSENNADSIDVLREQIAAVANGTNVGLTTGKLVRSSRSRMRPSVRRTPF